MKVYYINLIVGIISIIYSLILYLKNSTDFTVASKSFFGLGAMFIVSFFLLRKNVKSDGTKKKFIRNDLKEKSYFLFSLFLFLISVFIFFLFDEKVYSIICILLGIFYLYLGNKNKSYLAPNRDENNR